MMYQQRETPVSLVALYEPSDDPYAWAGYMRWIGRTRDVLDTYLEKFLNPPRGAPGTRNPTTGYQQWRAELRESGQRPRLRFLGSVQPELASAVQQALIVHYLDQGEPLLHLEARGTMYERRETRERGAGVAVPGGPARVQRARKDILRFLADGCWHTRAEIGNATGMDENTLRRPLDLLVKEKTIEWERKRFPRTHCIYRYRPPLVLDVRP